MPARLVYVVTDPLTAHRFLDGQLAYMREHGFDVTVIASPGELLELTARREEVRAVPIPMHRGISPAADGPALLALTRTLRKLRPDLVVAGTPKAGLLGTLAARLARVPAIVYHLRGLRFETATGAARALLLTTERVAALAAHRIQCNGESLRRELVEAGCAPLAKTWVPGSGTSNGVDAARFELTPERRSWAAAERTRLGFASEDFVIGFVGRLTRDKGIAELVRAFDQVQARAPRARLLVVGEHDATDPLDPLTRASLDANPRITRVGHVDEPAPYYALMSVLAFPSHREGFPNVPLEAASAAVPTVGYRATGTVDAVVDGTTGTLVPVGDEAALCKALLGYASDPALRRTHGENARRRVLIEFDQERLWEALARDYTALVAERRRSA